MVNTIYELAWIFFIYSFIGWCGEVIVAAVNRHKFVNRGFIAGPLCPIYGTGAVAVAALYHDASEILTGDMPTPIKYDNPAIRKAYKEVEAVAEEKLLHMLPEEFQPVYAPILTVTDPETERLVKAADKLSAHIKCLEELKAGNLEFRRAAEQTEQALDDFHLPELTYFREHFLPSFRLTLDEME